MKKTFLTLIILFTGIIFTLGQSSLGFNYQSVIRDTDGAIIADTEIAMRMGIVQSTIDGTAVYTETHPATTNAFGLVNIVIGQGTVVSGDFATIDWGTDNYFLRVEIDLYNSGSFTEIRTTQLLSVPFANYAFTSGTSEAGWIGADQTVSTDKKVGIGTSNPTSNLQIVATQKHKADDPIFEIKNADGKTVFAVFENEVKVYIDDTEASPGFTVSNRNASNLTEDIMVVGPQNTNIFVGDNPGKATFGGFAISGRTTTKEIIDILSITPELTEFFIAEPNTKAAFGGFAISGRTTTKAVGQNLLNITPSLTKFTIEQPTKADFGGFAISGRTTTKGEEIDVLTITPDYTRFYVDEPNEKAAFGGFAISGRTTTKGINDEIFKVTPGLTEVFIDENQTKAAVGGFAISGRTTTKDAGLYDIFRVQPHKTDIYLKKSETKRLPDGFSISGLNANLESTELFTVSDSGAFINTPLTIAPKVMTGDTTNVTNSFAMIKSSILNNIDAKVTKVGIIFSTVNSLNPIENIEDPSREDVKWNKFEYPNDFNIELENLTRNTKYYYKAFAINSDGLIGYGTIKSFTTTDAHTVTFEVIDQATDALIDTVEISLTHVDGNYIITNTPGNNEFKIAGGTYDFYVYAQGYNAGGSYYLDIISDTTITVYLATNELARITFHVKDENNNNIENAEISVSYGDPYGFIGLRPTNKYGITYSMLGGSITKYSATANGYDTIASDITMPAADTLIEIVLPTLPSRQVTFMVTYAPSSEAIPAPGATVTIEKMRGIENYSKTLITNPGGIVIFDDVPDAYLEYSIRLNEYVGSGEVETGGDKTINQQILPY